MVSTAGAAGTAGAHFGSPLQRVSWLEVQGRSPGSWAPPGRGLFPPSPVLPPLPLALPPFSLQAQPAGEEPPTLTACPARSAVLNSRCASARGDLLHFVLNKLRELKVGGR